MDITALHRLSYGLYIVGVKTPDGFGGCVVDAVAQVTSDNPPSLILSSVKGNYTNERIRTEGEFTLSVLVAGADPFIVANFGFQSARTAAKWPNVPHEFKDGLPVVKGSAAWMRCRVTEAMELSTHTLFICRVTDAWNGAAEAKPLIYADYQKTMKSAALEAFKTFKAGGKASEVKLRQSNARGM
jgi:flavin reductase (DIM6/NTAB) family NADH-FMN oxidoreductase RutF